MPSLLSRWYTILPLLILSAALLHTALVSSLLKLNFIDAAQAISINNADVYEAQALKHRQYAIASGDLSELDVSLNYWQKSIELRPLWPYYQLGALDVEVIKRDRQAVNQRIKAIINLAPNERGLDRSLLILAFLSWQWLEQEEKTWMLNRLAQVRHSVLKEVFSYAQQAQNQGDICAYLAWNKVKKLCSRAG